MNEKKNAIAIVVNNAYSQYALSLVNSIKINWESHPVILLFLHKDVLAKYIKIFESFSKLIIHQFDPDEFEYRKYLKDNDSTFGS